MPRSPPSRATAVVAGVIAGLAWGGVCGGALGELVDRMGRGDGGFFSLPTAYGYVPLGMLLGAVVGAGGALVLHAASWSVQILVGGLAVAAPLGVELVNTLVLSEVAKTRRQCERGDGLSCDALGRMYFDGDTVSADPVKGLALAARGCTLGYAEGCSSLGRRYRDGDGVPANGEESQRYFQTTLALDEASCRGKSDQSWGGCLDGAAIYLDGRSGERRPDLAAQLLLLSCDRSIDQACTRLADLILSKEDVRLDAAQTARALERACKSSPRACVTDAGR